MYIGLRCTYLCIMDDSSGGGGLDVESLAALPSNRALNLHPLILQQRLVQVFIQINSLAYVPYSLTHTIASVFTSILFV